MLQPKKEITMKSKKNLIAKNILLKNQPIILIFSFVLSFLGQISVYSQYSLEKYFDIRNDSCFEKNTKKPADGKYIRNFSELSTKYGTCMDVSGNFKNGLKNGVWKEYHWGNTLKSQTTYINNLKSGESKVWYENGNLKSITFYVKNKPEGHNCLVEFYDNGLLKGVKSVVKGKTTKNLTFKNDLSIKNTTFVITHLKDTFYRAKLKTSEAFEIKLVHLVQGKNKIDTMPAKNIALSSYKFSGYTGYAENNFNGKTALLDANTSKAIRTKGTERFDFTVRVVQGTAASWEWERKYIGKD